jgi:hypothetical protein
MPRIPAICNTCGTIFESFVDVKSINNTFTNCSSGPCPKCGGMGDIPNGVYSAVSETILEFTSGDISKLQLKKFLSILESAKDEKTETNELAKSIRTQTPELKKISDILPKTRQELYLFLTLIITIIYLFLDQPSITNNDVDVEKIINQSIEIFYNNNSNDEKTNLQNNQTHLKKVGRNQPCPCGSGRKFKHCCIK